MRFIRLLTLFFCLMSVTAIAQKRSRPIAFTHVTVIDATGTGAQSEMAVVVIGDKITDIGKFGEVKLPKSAQVVDAKGKFLIPGLWDMHVHLAKAGENALPLFIVNGITSVRDMGGDYVRVVKWRKEAADGTRLAPRIKTPGALLESAANVARMKREGTVEPVDKYRIGIATPEAMVEAGQKSIEHYIYPPIIKDPKHAEIYQKMGDGGVYVVPTIVVADKSLLIPYRDAKTIVDDTKGKVDFRRKYLSGYLLEDWKEQLEEKKQPSPVDLAQLKEVLIKDLQEMHKAGVRLMPGTDVAVLLIYPGYSLHDELQFLVKYVGLTPMEAIISATRYPAEFFGMQSTLGTIEKGKIADLILLDANPLDDISNTHRIAAVVLNGRYLSKAARERMLAGIETKATPG